MVFTSIFSHNYRYEVSIEAPIKIMEYKFSFRITEMRHVSMYAVTEIPVCHATVTNIVEVHLCPDGGKFGIFSHFYRLCRFVNGQ